MTDTKSQTLDWDLWFYWIMATTLGWILGGVLFTGLPMLASGVVIAGFQWMVLYRRIHKAWRWFMASAPGWIVGYIFFTILIPTDLWILMGPFMGGILGLTQWFIWKMEFEWAGWWIPISILAWTTGLTLLPGALTSGSLPAALTGLTLVIYFRYSPMKTHP